MKRYVLKHPNHETDLEIFVGEVDKNRLVISIPSESFSTEMLDGEISWGYTNMFGHPDFRKNFEDQLKKHL